MEEMAIAMSCNKLSSAYDRLGASHAVSYLVSKYLARKIKNIDMVSSLKGNE